MKSPFPPPAAVALQTHIVPVYPKNALSHSSHFNSKRTKQKLDEKETKN